MRRISLIGAVFLIAGPAAAQVPDTAAGGPELVDRVVAVVGDTTLLLSDVQTALQQLAASGRPLPQDPVQREMMAEEVLKSRIDDLILLESAQQAAVEVRDEEVGAEVDRYLQEVIQRFGSEQAFERALAREGLNRASYRQTLMEQYRNRALIDAYLRQQMAKRMRPLISEDQIRREFEATRSQLEGQTRPERVSLQQVIVRPQPSDSAQAEALETARQVLTELREGIDFEVLARRYSEDPGSAPHGGDLGWFKPGRMVKEFENVAFILRPGQTSGIVKTEFGYHIIRVDRVRGAERKARHILIKPEITAEDIAAARERADSVAQAIREGANPLELARRYDTPNREIEVTRIPLNQLPPVYSEAIGSAEPGAVVGPVELEARPEPRFAVLKVVDRQEAGPYTFEDVREQIRGNLEQQEMVEELLQELRNRVHVQVYM